MSITYPKDRTPGWGSRKLPQVREWKKERRQARKAKLRSRDATFWGSDPAADELSYLLGKVEDDAGLPD